MKQVIIYRTFSSIADIPDELYHAIEAQAKTVEPSDELEPSEMAMVAKYLEENNCWPSVLEAEEIQEELEIVLLK